MYRFSSKARTFGGKTALRPPFRRHVVQQCLIIVSRPRAEPIRMSQRLPQLRPPFQLHCDVVWILIWSFEAENSGSETLHSWEPVHLKDTSDLCPSTPKPSVMASNFVCSVTEIDKRNQDQSSGLCFALFRCLTMTLRPDRKKKRTFYPNLVGAFGFCESAHDALNDNWEQTDDVGIASDKAFQVQVLPAM